MTYALFLRGIYASTHAFNECFCFNIFFLVGQDFVLNVDDILYFAGMVEEFGEVSSCCND